MRKNILFFITLFMLLTTAAWGADRRSVNVPIANVRSGPGDNYKVLWKLEKYHPIQIIQTNGKWYKFSDFEGDKAWIHDSVLSSTPSVIVKKENCNIRSGPGTEHKIVFRVGRGVPFKVLDRKGKWIHVQHSDGDKGWIFESLVW